MKRTLFLLVLVSFFLSCSEQMIVIPPFEPIITERVILVEELTGASCPNCPKGTAALDALLEKYGDQVVTVSIHGQFLAEPISGKSKYDFRNEEGDELEAFFKPWFGKPAACINRVEGYDDFEFAISTPELWDQFVNIELQKEHVMELESTSINFDTDTRNLSLDLEIIPLIELEGNYRISVMITESHIFDAQKDESEIIDNYEFNHTLKMMMTETFGNSLGTLEKNKRTNKSFSAIIPTDSDHPELWNPINLEVVAFVHRTDDSHKEVMQALKVHFPQ